MLPAKIRILSTLDIAFELVERLCVSRQMWIEIPPEAALATPEHPLLIHITLHYQGRTLIQEYWVSGQVKKTPAKMLYELFEEVHRMEWYEGSDGEVKEDLAKEYRAFDQQLRHLLGREYKLFKKVSNPFPVVNVFGPKKYRHIWYWEPKLP